jgi:hypothetical protein
MCPLVFNHDVLLFHGMVDWVLMRKLGLGITDKNAGITETLLESQSLSCHPQYTILLLL